MVLGGFVALLLTGFLYDRYLTKKEEKEDLTGELKDDCFDVLLPVGNGGKAKYEWIEDSTTDFAHPWSPYSHTRDRDND